MARTATRGYERAELAYQLYAELGDKRSIRTLAERMRDLGIPVAEGTLRGYSVRYGWQDRLRERAADLEREQRRQALTDYRDVVNRQRQVGRGLTNFGLQQLREIAADPERRSRIGVPATVRAVDVGMRLDREALGNALALDRLVVALAEQFLPAIAQLIRELVVPLDSGVARDLADGIDAELRRVYEALLRGNEGTAP